MTYLKAQFMTASWMDFSLPHHNSQWVVSASQASQLLERGATILDVRHKVAWVIEHVSGAVCVTWQQFSQQRSPDRGKLIESNVLAQKLRAIGISNSKPVIVVGNPPNNFGEEGRIVWMLRTLGHSQAAFVDGGYAALVQAGVKIERGLTQPQLIGDFDAKPTALWLSDRGELKANLAPDIFRKSIIIDTREQREYAGSTPYGERRGGHVPGAVHFYFKDLMDEKGYLLKSDRIFAKLEKLGIDRDTAIVAYCTGGIRSAFFAAVLVNLGFTNVKNYAGSMWEWSSASASAYPLEKP